MLPVGSWLRIASLSVLLAWSCHRTEPEQHRPAATARPVASTAPVDAELALFRELFALSEAGESFISDNLVSNETSLLQPARELSAVQGRVYVGVGPEQNFTYIALSRPKLAILIDLRRDNALLHLLYKSIFEQAATRLQFASLLFGRPYDPSQELPAGANIDGLLSALEKTAPLRGWFDQQHELLMQRVRNYALNLTPADLQRIDHMHEQFFTRQLELRFELHQANARQYPPLRKLLGLRDRQGTGTFLDSETSFQFVAQLQKHHHVVPMVGDVSASRPLSAVAEKLRARGMTLGAFYISNVEQYLVWQPSFDGWLGNLTKLPHDEESLLVRCYLDQGQPHPRQAPGQRTTTLAHRLDAFLRQAKKKPYRTYFDIAADEGLLVRR